jgi:hypothetical protein
MRYTESLYTRLADTFVQNIGLQVCVKYQPTFQYAKSVDTAMYITGLHFWTDYRHVVLDRVLAYTFGQIIGI